MPNPQHRSHIQVKLTTETETFKARGGGKSPKLRPKDPKSHSETLRSELEAVLEQYKQVRTDTSSREDYYITVILEAADESLITNTITQLDKPSQGLKLMNLKVSQDYPRSEDAGSESPPPTGTSLAEQDVPSKQAPAVRVMATITLNSKGKMQLEKELQEYGHQTTKKGKPKKEKLYSSIEHIEPSTVESLYTDTQPLPLSNQYIWWELWLTGVKDEELKAFQQELISQGIPTPQKPKYIGDKKIVCCYTNIDQLQGIIDTTTHIAEIRQMPTVALIDLGGDHQRLSVDSLLSRVIHSNPHQIYLLSLDRAVDITNPLIQPHMKPEHHYRYHKGSRETRVALPPLGTPNIHGTAMAGLCLFGDLEPLLNGNDPIEINWGLESAYIFPRELTDNELENYFWPGEITEQTLLLARRENPEAKRIVCSTLTHKHGVNSQGQANSWSSALDQLAYGNGVTTLDQHPPQLFIVSAGNTLNLPQFSYDLTACKEEGIHTPGQAWNILTVGAYTEKTQALLAGLQALAPAGGLTPTSTTSEAWPNHAPIKPDIVCEGGNLATDGQEVKSDQRLSVLTTDANGNHLGDIQQTSAATGLAAHIAARIHHHYPNVRPETIRALLVHSADWTQEMCKDGLEQRIRRFGYGVPQKDRALFSNNQEVTLILEDEIRPFYKDKNDQVKYFHLPWPTQLLSDFANSDVTLKITLSYFIEPNPGERGNNPRYAYQSHQLHFLVRNPGERPTHFKSRVNAAHVTEEVRIPTKKYLGSWIFGNKLKSLRTSILSDTWRGPIAELLDMDTIAIYPRNGWWKHKRSNKTANFSLVISLSAPSISADLYSSIASIVNNITLNQTQAQVIST